MPMFACGKADIYNRQRTDNSRRICSYWDFRAMQWDTNKTWSLTACFAKTSLSKHPESLLSPRQLTASQTLQAQTRSSGQITGTKPTVLCTQETRQWAAHSTGLLEPVTPHSHVTSHDADTKITAVCLGQRNTAQWGWNWRAGQPLFSYSTIFWPAAVDL